MNKLSLNDRLRTFRENVKRAGRDGVLNAADAKRVIRPILSEVLGNADGDLTAPSARDKRLARNTAGQVLYNDPNFRVTGKAREFLAMLGVPEGNRR